MAVKTQKSLPKRAPLNRERVLRAAIALADERGGQELTMRKLATELGVEMMVTLGALLADVPHTRPVRVTGTAADPALVKRLGLERSRYEGPTGIVGVLHEAFSKAKVPSASLWARSAWPKRSPARR